MAPRFAPTALMLGNFVIGTTVLAPTGMLHELAHGLGVSIQQAGLLVTFGAVVMCFGSPLLSWSTSRIDRRVLLATSLALISLTHLASAFATTFTQHLVLRLLMVASAAPFTPQAASTTGLLVPVEKRASTISYVFLGWSLSAAFGIPMVAFVASRLGYAFTYGVISALAALSCVLLWWRLPRGLFTPKLLLSSWSELARNRLVLFLLTLTSSMTAGQFLVFTFLSPLLAHNGANADFIGIAFAVSGVMGFVGNLIASRVVAGIGPYRTELMSTSALALGSLTFAAGHGQLWLMVLGLGIWGLGFASTNSMQQARLVAAAPPLAGASVALNTSAIYVGQALGSALGGALFAAERELIMGFAAFGFIVLGQLALLRTRPSEALDVSALPLMAKPEPPR